MKKIAVITGTRAEYGILKPLLNILKKSKEFQLNLIVTGMHLLKEYGLTYKEIEKDGFKLEKVKMYEGNNKALALSNGIKGISEVFLKTKPDILIVFGDRLEPLAGALAAANLKIPIVHIHGGDKTNSGHIDESIRHSISRFSHIHLAPTEKSAERLLKMGEEKWRIYNIGALGLDSFINEPILEKRKLFEKLGLNPGQKTIICLFHPVHLEADSAGKQMKELTNVLKELKIQTALIYPNNDAGSENIIKEIHKIEKLPFIKSFKNLVHSDYLNLLKNADLLVGNSSSGLVEAPSAGLPVINVGNRNTGREHGDNIFFIPCQKDLIKKEIKKQLERKARKYKNPYYKKNTSQRAFQILKELKLNEDLMRKKITY